MQLFIYDNATNSLRIDDYSILLVKEFAKLWELERNKCKEDKSGELRLRAYKEFTYIYLVLDFKSPYFKYVEREKHEAALADAGLTEEDLKNEDFLNAYRKYEEIQEADPILALIKTAYHTIYKMRVHLDSIDFSETDIDGKPLYKPKDVIGDLTSISKIRTELQTLEQLHKTGLAAQNKTRGDQTPGEFDF